VVERGKIGARWHQGGVAKYKVNLIAAPAWSDPILRTWLSKGALGTDGFPELKAPSLSRRCHVAAPTLRKQHGDIFIQSSQPRFGHTKCYVPQ